MRVSRFVAVVVSFVAISAATPALASGPCNTASLNGSYAFQVDGTNVSNPNLPPGPFAAVGKNTYDGKGNMTGTITVSAAGLMIDTTYTGNYSVDGGCSGTKSATLLSGLTVYFDFVIDSNGSGIQMIVTGAGADAGLTVSGNARKLFTGAKDQGSQQD